MSRELLGDDGDLGGISPWIRTEIYILLRPLKIMMSCFGVHEPRDNQRWSFIDNQWLLETNISLLILHPLIYLSYLVD